jgi:murein DD-endopeptidase MepM/ murein hydrolase activator NlpD
MAIAAGATVEALSVSGRGAAPAVRRGAAPGLAPPRTARPRTVTVAMEDHESLGGALVRAGVGEADAARVSAALADEFDVVNPHPGQRLALTLADRGDGAGPATVVSLQLSPSEDSRLDLRRGADGVLRVTRTETPAVVTPDLVTGRVEGSLYLSLVGQAVDPDLAARIVGLFGRRLDLSRDIRSGDPFRLVFEAARRVGASTAAAPNLLFAEIITRSGPARLYRFDPPGGGPAEFVDGEAGPRGVLLLRTPVDGARVTSAFGPRLHPILGYTRLHQGVDFAAPVGAPVLAAGDGVVEEAGWSGGYGRWLRIRHGQGLETGYAHLSAWAAGVEPGAMVRQGQVVAFVGASGLATGPHLHFEVFRAGARINPAGVDSQGVGPDDPGRTRAFAARRAGIDAEVTALETACGDPRPGDGNGLSACAG